MFTGIIETTGNVKSIAREGSNIHFTISSAISKELKIDQSVSHNGVCLTVVKLEEEAHVVTAIEETLIKSNLGRLKEGDKVNLERSMLMGGRLDGHIVQGHVDTTAECTDVRTMEGSWYFTFDHAPEFSHLLVEKGSVCINGVSLTLVDVKQNQFSVAIIPYTWEHTNFCEIKNGTTINLEFDVIGKYVAKMMEAYKPA